jgi:RNA polymerase sigma-70 factor (ECF subfamily)
MPPEQVSVRPSVFQTETAVRPVFTRVYGNRQALERQTFDREYILRLTRGDPETEREFIRYFGNLLLIKLRARLRSQQVVEDLRQETFLRVLKYLRDKGGIDYPERLGAFVNSVCEFVLAEYFRAKTRLQQIPENAPDPVDRRASAESEFITEERKGVLRQVLDTLPVADRKLLKAVFLEERDKDQICAELGISRQYLRVRVHRAIGKFREALEKSQTGAGKARAAGK